MSIRIKPSHRGRLHEKLGVPANKPIPPGKLAAALHSKSEELRSEAQFAKNAKSWKH
jgi:hypothetical protein